MCLPQREILHWKKSPGGAFSDVPSLAPAKGVTFAG
jgi:hypothetical protein